MILTTMRCGKTVGFWQDRRRVNVALTRAKHALRVVGSISTWKKGSTVMSELALDCMSRQVTKPLSAKELISIGVHNPLNKHLHSASNIRGGGPVLNSRAIGAAKANRTHLVVHNVREKGTYGEWHSALCKAVEKQGPEWNAECVEGKRLTLCASTQDTSLEQDGGKDASTTICCKPAEIK